MDKDIRYLKKKEIRNKKKESKQNYLIVNKDNLTHSCISPFKDIHFTSYSTSFGYDSS